MIQPETTVTATSGTILLKTIELPRPVWSRHRPAWPFFKMLRSSLRKLSL